jgi:hypothetical protein
MRPSAGSPAGSKGLLDANEATHPQVGRHRDDRGLWRPLLVDGGGTAHEGLHQRQGHAGVLQRRRQLPGADRRNQGAARWIQHARVPRCRPPVGDLDGEGAVRARQDGHDPRPRSGLALRERRQDGHLRSNPDVVPGPRRGADPARLRARHEHRRHSGEARAARRPARSHRGTPRDVGPRCARIRRDLPALGRGGRRSTGYVQPARVHQGRALREVEALDPVQGVREGLPPDLRGRRGRGRRSRRLVRCGQQDQEVAR